MIDINKFTGLEKDYLKCDLLYYKINCMKKTPIGSKKDLFNEMPWSKNKGSLAEMVRVASSDPVAWLSIFEDNQDNLISYINEYLEELNKLKLILKSKKHDDLLNYLAASKPKSTKLK